MKDDREWTFIEVLSLVLVCFSAFGALLVMVDPVLTFTTVAGTQVKLGGDGFSEQLKGAVVSMIMVGGFTTVLAYHLGSSKSGDKAQDSVNNMAQGAAALQADAVAKARAPALTEAPAQTTVTPAQPTVTPAQPTPAQAADGVIPAAAVATQTNGKETPP